MNSNINTIISKIMSFLFILIILTTPIAIIGYDVIFLKNNIPENSLTEYSQTFLLLGTTAAFTYLGYTKKLYDRTAFLIASFFICLLIRELDLFFDQLIFHGFWVYPALSIAISAIIYANQQREKTITALVEVMTNSYFPILCLGLGITLVYSRLIGMGAMWHQILGDDFQRIVKNIAEESSELLGYTIIFYASVNYVLFYIKQHTIAPKNKSSTFN
ncbi:hypothetical protein AYY26_21165 [Photobacterium phosphoreum]|uniref:hypothetical protein n=1 Tax=Photobacterium phosphoreum TaxID=659 RepID=UPI0007F947B0|nr:hypothetical protein [Photobacterium phosphoreum]OBU40594.1 hypothetical protein AYY26_21165 [Photobacterium phosphoreum]